METKIGWYEGGGYITATYDGNGDGSVLVASDINEGVDRIQNISVSTTVGENPKSKAVQINQEGMREVFTPNDGSFMLYDGGTLNVLKDEL